MDIRIIFRFFEKIPCIENFFILGNHVFPIKKKFNLQDFL